MKNSEDIIGSNCPLSVVVNNIAQKNNYCYEIMIFMVIFFSQLGNSRRVFESQNPMIGVAQSQDFKIENVAGIRGLQYSHDK